MSPVRRVPPKRSDTVFKQYMETKKDDSVVLGPIKRMLIERRALDPYEGRSQKVIHPSEMVRADWCIRAEYYKLTGIQPKRPEPIHFNLETVFGEGHLIEEKYQNWLWDAGLLEGVFFCNYCGHSWTDTAPDECKRPGCVGGRECLKYRQVPVWSEQYLIGGHADGQLNGGTDGVEIKSIGIGTLRTYLPELLATHTHEMPDGSKQIAYDDLWRSIQRPVPVHFRQGLVYGVILGWKRVVFIYECKWNQRTKEFTIKVNPEYIEDRLNLCLDVKYALEHKEAPRCTGGEGCTACTIYEPGEPDGSSAPPPKGDHIHTEDRPDSRRRKRVRSGQGRVGEEGAARTAPTRLRRPTATGRRDRSR